MSVLIFKTDIKTKKKVERLTSIFSNYSGISRWSVDTQDIDNVLKIVTVEDSSEREFIDLLQERGFSCEVLTD